MLISLKLNSHIWASSFHVGKHSFRWLDFLVHVLKCSLLGSAEWFWFRQRRRSGRVCSSLRSWGEQLLNYSQPVSKDWGYPAEVLNQPHTDFQASRSEKTCGFLEVGGSGGTRGTWQAEAWSWGASGAAGNFLPLLLPQTLLGSREMKWGLEI